VPGEVRHVDGACIHCRNLGVLTSHMKETPFALCFGLYSRREMKAIGNGSSLSNIVDCLFLMRSEKREK